MVNTETLGGQNLYGERGAGLGSKKYSLTVPSDDQEREQLRRIVACTEEVVPNNPAFRKVCQDYLGQLTRNISHFTGIWRKLPSGEIWRIPPQEFESEKRAERVHTLVGLNVFEESTGFLTFEDPARGQNDTWLSQTVVVNNLQNRHVEGGPAHTGRQLIHHGIKWAFNTLTFDGRERTIIRAAVVKGVPNSDRMETLLDHYGFEYGEVMKNQAEVFVRNEGGRYEPVTRHVQRMFLTREAWELRYPKDARNKRN